jgi:hypothetical protein
VISVKNVVIVLVLILMLMQPVLADRIEDVFVVSKDTNDRIKNTEKIATEVKTQADGFAQRLSLIEGKQNAVNENITGMLLGMVMLVVFGTAYVTYLTAVKPFKKEIASLYQNNEKLNAKLDEIQKEIKERKVVEVKKEAVEKPKVEYDLVEKKFCPEDGEEVESKEPFCSKHGKKYVIKKVRIAREAPAYAGAVHAEMANQLQNRVRKKSFLRKLIPWG